MSKAYELYKKTNELCLNYNYASYVISFDTDTICPKNNKPFANTVNNFFMEEIFKLKNSDAYFHCLEELLSDSAMLTPIEQMAIEREYQDLKKSRKLPVSMYRRMLDLQDASYFSWEEGRERLDFQKFEQNMAQLLVFYDEYVAIYKGKYQGYDILLNECEDDFTMEKYDKFFNQLEQDVLPLMKKILSMPKKYNEKITTLSFDIPTQKKLTEIIAKQMGYSSNVGYIGETIHPFTNSNNINDVRTTTAYNEKLLFSNLFSVMHEVGHALYELQNDANLNNTFLFGGTSCAIHESQSRFYENYLGRSKEWIEFLFPILQELFPQLEEFTVEDIYYYVNDVNAQLYRVEADELTYPFHVLIRYKIEKKLFNKEIEVKDINDIYNFYMQKYFNIIPNNQREGCFQDIHWTSGFGYFPTYALGSAMSAQFLHAMQKDFNPFFDLKSGDFSKVNEWLKSHVHCHGKKLKNLEVIKLATKEDFNPNYYTTYLINKFKTIYEVEQ